jgi:hypothetical protein
VNLLLWAIGVVLIAAGYLRARDPYRRYQALKAQQANVARYEAWRGGIRDTSETGADVAIGMYRRQAQVGALLSLAGFVLVFAGFLIR